MEVIQLQVLLIASLAACACALPGVFLVLRGVALMSDAISHSVLLGIVLMFLWVQRLDSPWLFLGAICAGLATVLFSEYMLKIKYVKKDSAIALVFPFFFSLGVVLVSRFTRNIHLDTDMILLGELIFAPFNRLYIKDVDLGPIAIWQLLIIVCINITFIVLLYRLLIMCSFDQECARVQDVPVNWIYYGLMTITSMTAVAVFDIVGSIMTVALMICPAAIAYLISRNVDSMVLISCIAAIGSSIIGYTTAHILDVAIPGCITMWLGIFFIIALIGSPIKGILRTTRSHKNLYRLHEQAMIEAILQDRKYITIEQLVEITGFSEKRVKECLSRALK